MSKDPPATALVMAGHVILGEMPWSEYEKMLAEIRKDKVLLLEQIFHYANSAVVGSLRLVGRVLRHSMYITSTTVLMVGMISPESLVDLMHEASQVDSGPRVITNVISAILTIGIASSFLTHIFLDVDAGREAPRARQLRWWLESRFPVPDPNSVRVVPKYPEAGHE